MKATLQYNHAIGYIVCRGRIENMHGNYVNNIARTPLDPVLRRAAANHLELAGVWVSK
jgi:hypothetical protein